MLSTIIIGLQTIIVCVLCLAVHIQKKQIKSLEKMYRNEWYRGINGSVQSNLWKEKHDKLAEIIEIKETRIKDLGDSLKKKDRENYRLGNDRNDLIMERNIQRGELDKMTELLEIKETRIKDLESSLEEKSWLIDKLEDDLVVSQRHVNELKNELTQTQIMCENQISVSRLCRTSSL